MIRHYNVALVSTSKSVTPTSLSLIAAAISTQLVRDVANHWNYSGTVTAFADSKAVPLGFYVCTVADNIDQPGADGYHTDENNQPYALIQAGADWSITASHEIIEMLGDPWGNRLYPGIIQGITAQVLEELCDPCEGFSYKINGVDVSEFVLPEYYSGVRIPGNKYSFLGNCTAPWQVPENGYISYIESGEWLQETNFGGIQIVNLGPTSSLVKWSSRGYGVGISKSLREAIDAYGRANHPKFKYVKQ